VKIRFWPPRRSVPACLRKRCPPPGPTVRIHFPPAESLRTIGSAGREPPASDAARCGGITAPYQKGIGPGIWQYPQIPVTAGFLSVRRVTLSPLPHLRERGAYRAGGNLKHLSDERYSRTTAGFLRPRPSEDLRDESEGVGWGPCSHRDAAVPTLPYINRARPRAAGWSRSAWR